jgi:hypothetical protein
MKRLLACLALAFCSSLAFTNTVSAQAKQAEPLVGCVDPSVRQLAEHIKHHYTDQGFITARDAMIHMKSLDAFPVMLELKKGQLYQIIYVGQANGTVHKMVLYDGNDNVLKEKEIYKQKGELPGNYIIFEFTPDRTDTYLLMVMTKLKNKDFCGSITILTPDPAKGHIDYKPFQP